MRCGIQQRLMQILLQFMFVVVLFAVVVVVVNVYLSSDEEDNLIDWNEMPPQASTHLLDGRLTKQIFSRHGQISGRTIRATAVRCEKERTEWFCHVTRHNTKTILEAGRRRCRQRRAWKDGVKSWAGISKPRLLSKLMTEVRWRIPKSWAGISKPWLLSKLMTEAHTKRAGPVLASPGCCRS